ncbi:MAG: MBL fold metallo-hydrolase RNA specificity domain-containing protein [Nitrososphaerales archaeon]
MARAKISLRGGIAVEYGCATYALDPKAPARADYTFVSHAHLDHVQEPSRGSRVLASEETRLLAGVRGFDLGKTDEAAEGVALLDSGHILGARAICIGDELLYTGDAAGRDRAFMGRCRTRKARVLITESTFGRPGYVFPPISQVVKDVNSTIGMLFDRGRPVVLMGYALGKSQVLSHLFASWSPFYFHEKVAEINEVYGRCGVSLKTGVVVKADLAGLSPGPWVMVAPMMSSRSSAAQRLRKEHGAALVAFSGWAADPGYAHAIGADFAFAVSDHCDYPELLELVRGVSPEKVYTTHGFTKEFASDLRKEGFDAGPLEGHQPSLSEY